MFGVLVTTVVLAGCGTESSNQLQPGDGTGAAGGSGSSSDSPLITDDGDVLLSCGYGPPFWASAMNGGVSGFAEEDEVETALEEVVAEMGMDAPQTLQGQPVEEAEWMVLGKETAHGIEELVVAVGRWDSKKGPIDGGHMVLERTADGWNAVAWGDCNLAPELEKGVSWAELGAAPAGLDPASSTVDLEVSERECTSARDPKPFLHEPVIIESDDMVTVYLTSDTPKGAATCQGGPQVKMTIELDKPLGARALFDGSTWPPKRVTGS